MYKPLDIRQNLSYDDAGILIDPSILPMPEVSWKERLPGANSGNRKSGRMIKAQILERIPPSDNRNSTNKDKIKAEQYICRDMVNGNIYVGVEDMTESGTSDSAGYRIRQGVPKEGASEGMDTKNEDVDGEYVFIISDDSGYYKIIGAAKHPKFDPPDGLKENDKYTQVNGIETITKADGTQTITHKGGAIDPKTGKRPNEATAGTKQEYKDGKFSITNKTGGEFSMDTKTGAMAQKSKDYAQNVVGKSASKITGIAKQKIGGLRDNVVNGVDKARSKFELRQGGGPLIARQGDRGITTNAHGAQIVVTIMDGTKRASMA